MMKKYIIAAVFVLYNVTWTMDNTETMDFVINKLSSSIYRAPVNSQYKSSNETINQVIVIDEDGKKILQAYNATRLARKRFTMVNVSQGMQLQHIEFKPKL